MFRRTLLQLTFLCVPCAAAQTLGDLPDAPPQKVPAGVIFVKGAEPSASDRATPLPEDGTVARNVYQNRYLGLTYPLPADWIEPFKGPPPSEHGSYVLTQLIPSPAFKGPNKGTVLISAQDMFFALTPAKNAQELVSYNKEHLPSYYDVERPPVEVSIGGHSFARFDYTSAAAGLHWTVLATQTRCHALQFVFTSRDPELIAALIADMNRIKLPADADAAAGTGGGEVPVCLRNYARGENVVAKVDPDLPPRRFNQIPVRIIIDKQGRVKHVHIVSAFPDQATLVTDALMQWRFKPYLQDGQPVEVETGLMFGGVRQAPATTAASGQE